MALSRRPAVSARSAMFALAAAVGVALAPLPAQAAPEDPDTSQEAAALVAARGHDLEVVTEQFNEARELLSQQQASAATAATAVETAQTALADAQDDVRGVARGAFTANNLGALEAMLTSGSATEFVDRVATLDVIAVHQNQMVEQATSANEAAAEAREAAAQAAADAQAQLDRVAAQQADLGAQIAEYQADFAALSAEERRKAAEAHAAEAARAQASTSPSPSSASAGRTGAAQSAPPAPSAPVVANSAAAQIAVDTAMAQRGKPYVWGAAGPGSYDCSGLVQYAYAAAGIALPHSSRMQATMGRAVSRAELQPGDLVAYYSPVSHIGIYIGNGQIVHASTYGQPVKVTSMDSMGAPSAMRRIAG